ncbi:MAG: thioredoxin domain-containing protein [Gemmatimonadaceae bacterium]
MRLIQSARAAIPICFLLTACGGKEARAKPTADDAATVLPATASNAAAPTDPRVTAADLARVKGDTAAKVWLVIVSDWQCPFCKIWHDSTAATIEKEYVATGKVRMAYVNFPLRMHQHAREASEAGMCAAAQGKFWEYGEALFKSQAEWAAVEVATPNFEAMATSLSLDMPAWRSCMSEHVMEPMIQADYDRGVKANVNSTPTFFVGNQVIEGADKAPAFRAALDKALAGIGK